MSAKILEAAAHHLLRAVFGPILDSRQYAYRRAGSTELHLLELFDFVAAARTSGEYEYIASVAVDGPPLLPESHL